MSIVGESLQAYHLLLNEQQLASQYAQDPATARKLINFIPSRAGDLKRKPYSPPFSNTEINLAASDYWYSFAKEFRFYDASGDPDLQTILAVSNNVGTFLYKFVSGGTITALPAGAFSPPHNESGGVRQGWVGDPLILYSDGLMFISDGFFNSAVSLLLQGNWTVYDGINTWKGGMDRPSPPSLNGSSTPGSIQIDLYREYVITEYDSVRGQESIPSTRFRFNSPSPATYDVTLDLPVRVNKPPGTTLSDWTTPGASDIKFRIYASHIDGSGRLFRIAEVPASDSTSTFIDTVPFWGESLTTAMVALEPPFRNQKPKPSLVGAKMGNRFAIRDEDRRSRIWVTGFEEVREQDPASSNPLETVPGAQNVNVPAVEDKSDFENFIELPDETFEVRALKWWGDALMVGTERGVNLIWGDKPENFLPSKSTTYGFGVFNKNAFLETPHGLVIYTSDRKLVIDRANSSGLAGGNRTSYVDDIGWPKQLELDQTDIQFTNRFQMVHWNFGSERDMLVLAYTRQNVIDGGTAHLLVYSFELGVEGWLTFDDTAATCIGIIQEKQGFEFLVAGNSVVDRKLKVVLDFNAAAASPYQAADTRVGLPAPGTETLPANTFRTALMDIDRPNMWKIWRFLSYFKKGSFTVVVTAYFDPADIDNLPAGTVLNFDSLGTQELRAFMFTSTHHKRAVFDFTIAADGNSGALQGIEINVEPTTNVGV